MYFRDLQTRLIETARQRVRSGYISERGLARICGLSQPHMHNVLHQVRSLSPAAADRLLQALALTVPDLLAKPFDGADAEVRAIPILRTRIGPAVEAAFTVHGGHMAMPVWLLKGLVEPVLARLAPDLALPRSFAAGDLVLLDQNTALRKAAGGRTFWIVAEGSGLRVRHVKMSGSQISTASELDTVEAGNWRRVLAHGRDMLQIVRARIVWFGRELISHDAPHDLDELV